MYSKQLSDFLKNYKPALDGRTEVQKEMAFERLYVGEAKNSIEYILNWYEKQKANCEMSYEHIPLNNCVDWSFNDETGSFVHSSGEFFRVDGIRISNTKNREVTGGWDQPILTQIGYDGGILGLIRKRINGVPHYLVEAKAEPGNFGIVQISTTLQATFSNIKQAHKGNKTLYSEFFMEPEKNNSQVIFRRWMSEDGGRLLNKRNLSMIVEAEDIGMIPESFLWLTLHQLIEINRTTDAIIAPHIRGILSAL